MERVRRLEDNRRIEDLRAIRSVQQEEGESFQSFFNRWTDAVAKLPKGRMPEPFAVCMCIFSLNDAMRTWMLSQEIPETWDQLQSEGRYAEVLLRTIASPRDWGSPVSKQVPSTNLSSSKNFIIKRKWQLRATARSGSRKNQSKNKRRRIE